MKNEIENKKVENLFRVIDELENLLTERIADLHEVRGGMSDTMRLRRKVSRVRNSYQN